MDKKGYYAIIPASVRYDARLTPNAKLLYGEITALCNEKGYCWASNAYFSDLYDVTKATVSAWIGNLKDAGYITVSMQYKEGTKHILHRYIRIFDEGIQDNLNTPTRKLDDPIQENLKDNNTVNNTTNITVNSIDHFDSFWSVYPKKAGKQAARKAWNKLKPSDEIVQLIAINLKARLDAGEWEDTQFVPHASTYLNGARWEDEVETKRTQRKLNQESIKSQSIQDKLTDTSWV
jgi:DNA-binding transcriptional ArsR family regulator